MYSILHAENELMNCLLICATATEIEPFLSGYHAGGTLPKDVSVDILIGGVGLMATTYALSQQLRIKRPDMIIQAGIAGGFDMNSSLGTVVAVKRDIVADLGVIENKTFKSVFDLQLAVPNMHPYTKGWLENDNEVFKKSKVKKVNSITTNEITTSKERIKIYEEKFSPVVESMEGAAVHYVSIMEKLPFIQLRAISNYIGERKKDKWKIKESIINLNKELYNLLNTL